MSLPKIFINYRIADTAYVADQLVEFLQNYLPKEKIFIDLEIPPGGNFDTHIRERLEETEIVLSLIGQHWEYEIEQRYKNRREDWVIK